MKELILLMRRKKNHSYYKNEVVNSENESANSNDALESEESPYEEHLDDLT